MDRFIELVKELYEQYNLLYHERNYNRILDIQSEIRNMTSARVIIAPSDGPVSIYGLSIWIDTVEI